MNIDVGQEENRCKIVNVCSSRWTSSLRKTGSIELTFRIRLVIGRKPRVRSVSKTGIESFHGVSGRSWEDVNGVGGCETPIHD